MTMMMMIRAFKIHWMIRLDDDNSNRNCCWTIFRGLREMPQTMMEIWLMIIIIDGTTARDGRQNLNKQHHWRGNNTITTTTTTTGQRGSGGKPSTNDTRMTERSNHHHAIVAANQTTMNRATGQTKTSKNGTRQQQITTRLKRETILLHTSRAPPSMHSGGNKRRVQPRINGGKQRARIGTKQLSTNGMKEGGTQFNGKQQSARKQQFTQQ